MLGAGRITMSLKESQERDQKGQDKKSKLAAGGTLTSPQLSKLRATSTGSESPSELPSRRSSPNPIAASLSPYEETIPDQSPAAAERKKSTT